MTCTTPFNANPSRFTLTTTPIAGVVAVQRQPIADARGFLARLFCADDLAVAGWPGAVAQINHTSTAERGTVRGLHYQHPPERGAHAEAKLVSCLRGSVWDVVVDVRADSPTYLQWHAQVLSADNQQALLIPPGCAHGFQALEDGCELLYVHSAPYKPARDAGLHAQDGRLAITWPLAVHGLSAKDAGQPTVDGVGTTFIPWQAAISPLPLKPPFSP